jgi:hypothetical protein
MTPARMSCWPEAARFEPRRPAPNESSPVVNVLERGPRTRDGAAMRVIVPGWDISRRALEFGRELKHLKMSDFYEFDFQNVSFVTPAWLIVIGTALRRFREDRPDAKRRATNYKHLGYAAHVGFFQYFGLTYGLAPSEAKGSDTYVPITEIKISAIKERASNGRVHVGEIVEEESQRLAKAAFARGRRPTRRYTNLFNPRDRSQRSRTQRV